jgi:hypothetical protein
VNVPDSDKDGAANRIIIERPVAACMLHGTLRMHPKFLKRQACIHGIGMARMHVVIFHCEWMFFFSFTSERRGIPATESAPHYVLGNFIQISKVQARPSDGNSRSYARLDRSEPKDSLAGFKFSL